MSSPSPIVTKRKLRNARRRGRWRYKVAGVDRKFKNMEEVVAFFNSSTAPVARR